MKKYEVTYYSIYHVEAENKDEAIKKADRSRAQDLIKKWHERTEFSFGVEAEEINEGRS